MYKYIGFTFALLLFSVAAFSKQPPQVPEQLIENSSPLFITTELPDAVEGEEYSTKILVKDKKSKQVVYTLSSDTKGKHSNERKRLFFNESSRLSFTLKSGPEGLSLTRNGYVKWHPGYESAGEHLLKVSVSVGGMRLRKTFTLRVVNSERPVLEQIAKESKKNSAPEFSTNELPDAVEGEEYSTKILAIDKESKHVVYTLGSDLKGENLSERKRLFFNDSARLFFSLKSGPKGLSISRKGNVKWLPDYDSAGEYQLEVSVSDGEIRSVQSYTLKVNNTNRAPLWLKQAMMSAVEGQKYSVQLLASDPDTNKLSYSLKEGPQGLALSADGLLSWAPDFLSVGKHVVKVSVSDGSLTKDKTFKLFVENTNRSPEWRTQSLINAAEGLLYEVQLLVDDYDKENLKFSLESGPEGLKVGRGGLLKWTPSYDALGDHTIKVNVSDPYSTVDKTFKLVVDNTNRKPIIRSKLVERLIEVEKYSFVIEADDPDGNKLSYKLENAPEGASLKKNVISWTPGYEQAGDYSFSLIVSDAEVSVTKELVWSVKNTNRLPEWKTQQLDKAKEGLVYQQQLQAVDADRTTLTFKLDSGLRCMTVSPTGTLNWQPEFDVSGKYTIKFSVSDGEDSVQLKLPLDVENTNRKPEFTTMPVLQGKETAEYRYKVKVADSDKEDKGNLNVRIIQAPKLMTLVERQLVWQPGYEQSGDYTVELELADAEVKVQQKFTVTVENTNRLPVFDKLNVTTRTLTENKAWEASVVAVDADRQQVRLAMHEGPQGLSFNNNTLSWKPTFEQAGDHRVLLSASDGEGRVDYDLKLKVNNVNRLPIFTSNPVLSAKEVAAYQYVIDGADPDGAPLVYSLLQFPIGMMLINKVVSWTPNFEQSGQHMVVLQVANGETNVEQSFTVDVVNTNRKPIFNSAVQTAAKENSPYSYMIDVSDPDRTAVELTLMESPYGMKLKNNVLSWSPDFETSGSYSVLIEASDKEATTKQSFNLVVENTNRLPVVKSKPQLNAIETFPYSYKVRASDADRQDMTMTLNTAPEGMVIKDELIEWTPGYTQQGPQSVIIDITDGEDVVQQAFTIKVANTNREPNVAYIEDLAIIAGDTFVYQVEVSDKDGDAVSARLVNGPKRMVVKSDGAMKWSTRDKDVGSYTIVLSVTDGDLESRSHFEIHVLQRSGGEE